MNATLQVKQANLKGTRLSVEVEIRFTDVNKLRSYLIPYRLQVKLKNQLCHTETLKSKFHLNQGDDGSPTVHHDDSDSSDGENNGQSRSNYLTYLQGQMREWNGQISGIRPSDMQHVQTFLAEYPITEVLN